MGATERCVGAAGPDWPVWGPKPVGKPEEVRLYGIKLFQRGRGPASVSCSIVFIQWGGESERESVSCPEDTIAGSSTVRSGAPVLLQPD